MCNNKIWERIKEYCNYYHLPLNYIVEVLSDLKVIPMLRGKGFEFTIFEILGKILPKEKWEVSIPNINAQSEIHDVDVSVKRKKDNKEVRIECKLAGKGSFRENKDNPLIKVKCMRSRTVSDNHMAVRMARKYGVSKEMVLAHADNYREGDFDFVVTSMGNAFWKTENEKYVFGGNKDNLDILSNIFPRRFTKKDTPMEFNKKTFTFFLFANSKDIIVNPNNSVVCTRKKCKNKNKNKNCGFIPNYPVVYLKDLTNGKSPWKPIENIEKELDRLLDTFG